MAPTEAAAGLESRRIVVGVDGSPSADRALDWAIGEAKRRGIEVHVVTAWRPPLAVAGPSSIIAVPQLIRLASHQADDIATVALKRVVGAGVTGSSEVVEGHPATALLDAAAGADQLVVGDRGVSAVKRFVLGSVSSAVVHHAQLPVTVVRGEPGDGRRRVVVGVDGSEGSRRAVARAAVEAGALDAELCVVAAWHVTDPDLLRDFRGLRMPPLDELHDYARSRAERAVTHALGDGAEVTLEVVHSDAVEALITASRDAALLVVGSRGHGAVGRMLLGSVASGCLHHSECPVQVVPPQP